MSVTILWKALCNCNYSLNDILLRCTTNFILTHSLIFIGSFLLLQSVCQSYILPEKHSRNSNKTGPEPITINTTLSTFILSWFWHCSLGGVTVQSTLLGPVRFEVFTAVRMMMLFWVLALCKFIGRCQHRNILSPTSGLKSCPSALKMETVCFSETLHNAK
jgi:hypothetical protein